MDFGIAKMPGQTQLTQDGSSLGTIAYMSPEQTRGHQVDQRTDIWSFGAMIYEMLTGEEPFKGHYNEAIVYSILNEPPESITSLRANVPEHLEQLVGKALQKNADERFQSIDELIAALEPQAGDSDQTDPETVVKNRTAQLGILAAIFVILISVFIIFQSDGPAEPETALQNESITANTHSQIMQELINIPDTPTFMNKLNELRKSMRIAVGNQDDFTTHAGCYIFVLGNYRVEAVFLFHSDRFYDISSNEILETLTDRYAGKTSIWVRDLSN
jgi:serine/threonine protein kinase